MIIFHRAFTQQFNELSSPAIRKASWEQGLLAKLIYGRCPGSEPLIEWQVQEKPCKLSERTHCSALSNCVPPVMLPVALRSHPHPFDECVTLESNRSSILHLLYCSTVSQMNETNSNLPISLRWDEHQLNFFCFALMRNLFHPCFAAWAFPNKRFRIANPCDLTTDLSSFMVQWMLV